MGKVTKYFENRQAGFTDRYGFEFRFEPQGFLTIWCIQHPPDPHGKSAEHHHLFASGKLCQRGGKESRSYEHAEAFAHWWMKRYSIYIRSSSGTFPMTSEAIDV